MGIKFIRIAVMVVDIMNFVVEYKFWLAALAPIVIGFIVLKIIG